jgi:hypothetical protein
VALPLPFTQAQLEIAVGGAADLLKLADKSGTGSLSSASCQAFIAEVQAAAAGEMYSILQVAFDPADSTFPAADFVKQNALTIGVYWAWHKSTGGLAVPEKVETAKDKAIATLEKAKDGFRSLGTADDPTSNAGAENVDLDTTGTRLLRSNMGGFC